MMGSPSLTAEQRANLAEVIEARISVLRADLKQELHRSEDPAALRLANHLEETDDDAVADLELATEIAGIQRELAELAQLEAARVRVRDGTYGLCISCETEIPIARLRVQPAAPRCISCQETEERLQRGSGTPLPPSL